MKSLRDQIQHHENMAEDAHGMADAAYGCGDRLGGDSYYETARVHEAKVRELTDEINRQEDERERKKSSFVGNE
jgi:hypothetical protein